MNISTEHNSDDGDGRDRTIQSREHIRQEISDHVDAFFANGGCVEEVKTQGSFANDGCLKGSLPTTGFMRLPQILEVIPVSKTTWWRWTKSGKAPKGILFTRKIRVWRVEDIYDLIEKLGQK